MEALFGLIETMLICGTLFGVAFLVVLSLAEQGARCSEVRHGGLAACAYVLCPVDIMPEAVMGFFGLFDDAGWWRGLASRRRNRRWLLRGWRPNGTVRDCD